MFWGVLSNILFICRGYGGYRAALHALPQVYGGVWVGDHCLSCIAGGVNCSNYYVWLTNFVQNRKGNCATFYGVGAGARVALVCGVDRYEKRPPDIRWPLGFTMVEQKPLTANTIYANSVEIKVTRNWFAIVTFCESNNKK